MRPQLHVLFIGKHNNIRSVLAETLLHNKINKARLGKQFTCSSCGTDSLASTPPPKDMQVFAKKHGYDMSGKLSSMLTKQMIESADIVFTIDRPTQDYVAKKYKLQKHKIFLLKQFDIEDTLTDLDIRDISENHEPADIMEVYGKLKKEINRIFEKLAAISNKKVIMAKEYNRRKIEAE